MKRVRLMLMLICIIAITGGVLAFKAMTPMDYCTKESTFTTTQLGGQSIWTCQELGVVRDCGSAPEALYLTTTTASINFFCYTLTGAGPQPCRIGIQPTSPLRKCDIKGINTTEPGE